MTPQAANSLCLTTADNVVVGRLRASLPNLIAIYRFGSTARAVARADSDIDFAFLAREPIDVHRRFELQEEIACALGRDVDLVDLRRASTVLRMQIVSTALIVAEYDLAAKSFFEMYTYSDYARLNEERAGILERVRREGTVYGR